MEPQQQPPNHYLSNNSLLTDQLRRLAQAQTALELTRDSGPQYRRLVTALVQEQYRLHRQLRILTMLANYTEGEVHVLRDNIPRGGAHEPT